MKYPIPDHAEEYKLNQSKYTEIGHPNGKSVKVYEDGSVEAHSFIDKDHENLDYDFDSKRKVPFFKKNINDDLNIKFIPNSFKVYYEAVCEKIFSVVNGFGKFVGNIKTISLKSTGRYKHARRVIRKGIDSILKDKKRFAFSELKLSSSKRTIVPYVESTTFGPYNYPVRLKTSSKIDFIKDLIVIKTGGYTDSISPAPDKSQTSVVYVSPHIEKNISGYLHTSTGINLEGNLSIVTGQNLNDGIASGVSMHYLSSENYSIPSGTYLNGSGSYEYYDDGQGNETPSTYIEGTAPNQTHLYEYNKFTTKVSYSSEQWDGVIPSGAWFSINTWCYNDKYIGFDGDISIEPVDQTKGVTYSETVIGKAEDTRGHKEAYQKAEKSANKKFYRSLNKKLIDAGLRNKNSNHRSFDEMVYKSAQGYYDKVNNKLINDYDLEHSANPTGQNFYYKEEYPSDHMHDSNVQTTSTSSSTQSASSSTQSSSSSSSGGSSSSSGGSSSGGGGY